MKWQAVIKPKNYQITVSLDEEIGLIIFIDRPGVFEVTVNLAATGAKALILGIIKGEKNADIQLKTNTRHLASNTHAETIVYGALKDSARAVIKGMIEINKKANLSTDFLTEKILLLGETAQAIAEPALEIKANEVRASHAATIATLDEEALYYLQSRGLTKEQAKLIIISGFFKTVLNRINDDKIKKQICLMLKK